MLVFATSLLAVCVFEVKVSSLSGLVVQVDFPPGTMETLLGLAVLYFVVTFSFSLKEDLDKDAGRKIEAGVMADEMTILRGMAMSAQETNQVFQIAFAGESPSINDVDLEKLKITTENATRIYERFFPKPEERLKEVLELRDQLRAIKIDKLDPIIVMDREWLNNVRLVNHHGMSAIEHLVARLSNQRRAAVYTPRLILVEIVMPGSIVLLAIGAWCSDYLRGQLSDLFIENSVQTAYIELLRFNTII